MDLIYPDQWKEEGPMQCYWESQTFYNNYSYLKLPQTTHNYVILVIQFILSGPISTLDLEVKISQQE